MRGISIHNEERQNFSHYQRLFPANISSNLINYTATIFIAMDLILGIHIAYPQ